MSDAAVVPAKRLPVRVLDALMSSKWAMEEEYLRTMLAVVQRETDLQAIERQMGRPLDHTYAVTVRDGVAMLPLTGPMFRYANLFTAISGATSYELLATDLGTAMADPAIRAVVLNIDSPGGDVNGCAELAALIASYRGTKPIVSYISNLGASAAYWLASAADRIVANETAIVGSIGIRFTMVDTSGRDQANGIRRIEIISSQSPRKNDTDPRTESGREAAQRMADALAEVFIERVAEYRGVSDATVREQYGQGGVFVGEAALAAGLVDSLGTLESVLTTLADSGTRSTGRAFTAKEERRMSDSEKTPSPTADASEAKPDAATAAAAAQPATGAAAAAEPSDKKEVAAPVPTAEDQLAAARADARAEERERILGIEKLARPGLEQMVAEAKADPTCTPAMFAQRVLEADAQKGRQHLANLKADEDQLKAPAARAVAPGASDGAAEADRILSLYYRQHPSRAEAQRN